MVNDNDVYDHLAHYGVKGMRWGIRKDRRGSSNQTSITEKIAQEPKREHTAEQKKNIANAEKKFEQQFETDEAPKGWRPTKKQVALIAAGTIATAAVIYTIKTKNAPPSLTEGFSKEAYLDALSKVDSFGQEPAPDWFKDYAGKPMSPDEYRGLIDFTKSRVWQGNLVSKDSFDMPEQVFSAGHEFFRLSHNEGESSFSGATYMLGDKEDLARYFHGWKEGQGTNLVNFNAKSEIRVPDLTTRLNAMREAWYLDDLARGVKPPNRSPEEVLKRYSGLTGGSWKGPFEERFFSVLSEKGYHAIVDDMDAGVYGRNPMVLFDSSVVTAKRTTLNGNVDANALLDILTEIPNRR